MDYLSLRDWWRRQAGLAAGIPAAEPTPFERDTLLAQGGIDTRASENGTPDFNTVGAQADLLGAKTAGLLRDKNRMMPLLMGIGLLGGGGRSGGGPPAQLSPRPYSYQGGSFMDALGGLYGDPRRKRQRMSIFEADE